MISIFILLARHLPILNGVWSTLKLFCSDHSLSSLLMINVCNIEFEKIQKLREANLGRLASSKNAIFCAMQPLCVIRWLRYSETLANKGKYILFSVQTPNCLKSNDLLKQNITWLKPGSSYVCPSSANPCASPERLSHWIKPLFVAQSSRGSSLARAI